MSDQDLPDTVPDRISIVGIKVRDRGEIKKTRTEDYSLKVGDHVLLELEHDQTYGTVYSEPQFFPFSPPMRVMKHVLRKATEEDERTILKTQQLGRDGWDFCLQQIATLGLRMKLIEVYGAFQRRTLTFTYTANGRIDFRQLVKDLARRFGCRIEMRQISTREEAGLLSGVDTCGLVLCCASFLTDFKPFSPKGSRRDMGMPSSAEGHRIGVCGRLKCCLMFEEEEWPLPKREAPSLIQPVRL